MRELIEEVFAPPLANAWLDTGADAVSVPSPKGQELVLTTDGFTVKPLEFPGGDIGSLCVHGTVNDLAVAGATPRYLTLNAFIEEGLDMALLRRVVASIGQAASDCGVAVVAGDTKVVGRGECDGLYLATTGVGWRNADPPPSMAGIKPGDRLLISGPIGDHGTAVLLARGEFGLQGDLVSDAASILPLAQTLLTLPGLRFMRDPTRGGLATVCHELARATGLELSLDEATIPVRDSVQSVCELLGFDPLFLACEGRLLAVVAADAADAALTRLQSLAPQAALIGQVQNGPAQVVLRSAFGGERLLDELEHDPLPRIC